MQQDCNVARDRYSGTEMGVPNQIFILKPLIQTSNQVLLLYPRDLFSSPAPRPPLAQSDWSHGFKHAHTITLLSIL
jgi:hypothetical protein